MKNESLKLNFRVFRLSVWLDVIGVVNSAPESYLRVISLSQIGLPRLVRLLKYMAFYIPMLINTGWYMGQGHDPIVPYNNHYSLLEIY